MKLTLVSSEASHGNGFRGCRASTGSGPAIELVTPPGLRRREAKVVPYECIGLRRSRSFPRKMRTRKR